jgi:hypothetical protein
MKTILAIIFCFGIIGCCKTNDKPYKVIREQVIDNNEPEYAIQKFENEYLIRFHGKLYGYSFSNYEQALDCIERWKKSTDFNRRADSAWEARK